MAMAVGAARMEEADAVECRLDADELAALLAEERCVLDGADGLDSAEEAAASRAQILREIGEFEQQVTAWRRERPAARPAEISASLIASRCLDNSGGMHDASEEERIDAILALTHVRLDGCGIGRIANLECMSETTHLYLQHNVIRRIEELDMLANLVVLMLSHNQIETVTGLSTLDCLRVLDLSHNRVSEAAPAEFPPSLRFLNLDGNPVAEDPDCRDALIRVLPRLVEFGTAAVTAKEREAIGAPPLEDGEAPTEDGDEGEAADASSDPGAKPAEPSEVDAVRERLITDYMAASRERHQELERVLAWDVDGMAGEQMDRALAAEHQSREARRRQRGLLTSAAPESDASAASQVVSAGRLAWMAADLQNAAAHQVKQATVEWEEAMDAGRRQLRERRDAAKKRSQDRQAQLLAGDSEAFTAAKSRLQEDRARRGR
eukprot:TRINITY_DN36696_c0_g1_i1.p1 TRINITY_DN36696_c0_g1~~TRINITY_DN36696_c0_g1_i1.p1  ORF type:complete len:445 (+),score=142.79 TRINITY_DN36696_c0_g1_i1:29-1336(+)